MHLKKIVAALLVFIIGSTGLSAYAYQMDLSQQPSEVSSEELERFASAFKEIQQIDRQLQDTMMKTVEEKGIEVARFNDYLEAQQNQSQEFDAPNQELEKYKTTFKEIEQMHDNAEQEMQQVITEKDLSVERYQQIAQSVQEDPVLLQKFQQLFEE